MSFKIISESTPMMYSMCVRVVKNVVSCTQVTLSFAHHYGRHEESVLNSLEAKLFKSGQISKGGWEFQYTVIGNVQYHQSPQGPNITCTHAHMYASIAIHVV